MLGYFLHRLFPKLFPLKTREIGQITEGQAAKFLRKKGFKILARNWRPAHGHGEIDLVAMEGKQLIFVEVRARSQEALVRGALSLDAHKKEVLRHTIEAYLRVWRTKNPSRATPPWRFDVVEVCLKQKGPAQLGHFTGTSL